MTRLPVLVSCDRLRARLTTAACVARYAAAQPLALPYGDQGGYGYTGCRGCPQGAERAGAQPAPAPVPAGASRDQVIAAVVAGKLGITDAARTLRVSHTMVGRWARRAGVPRAPHGTPQHPHHDAALAMVRAGRSRAETAASIGVSYRTVCRWVAEDEARPAT